MTERFDFDDNLYLNDNTGISVGFRSDVAIAPLRTMLEELFAKQVESNRRYLNDQEQKHKIETEKIAKQAHDDATALVERAKYAEIQRVKLSNHMETISKEMRNVSQKFQAFGKNFIFNMMKIVNKSFEQSVDVANTFRDIESSGVMVKDGFDSLWDSANQAGVQLNDFSKYLTKISPTIAKLNANMQNGVKLFGDSMNKISDAYGLTHDEQVAAFESAMDKLTPSQIRQMKEEELAQRVDETARNMKLLSLATGKTVENIKAENDAKSKTLRRQAYARSNPNADMFFKALNLSDEEVDYLLSGGVSITPEIVMKLANDQFYSAVMPELMKLAQTGGINDFNTVQSVMKRYAPLGQTRESEVIQAGMNPALYAASAMSKLFEYAPYSSFYGQGAQNLSGAPTFEEFIALQNKNNNILQEAQNANEAHNKYVNQKLDAISGNTASIAATFKLYGLYQNALGEIWDLFNDLVQGTPLEGIISQLLAGGLSLFGSQIGTGIISGIVNGFGKVLSPLLTLVGGIASKIGVNGSIMNLVGGMAKYAGYGAFLTGAAYFGNETGKKIAENSNVQDYINKGLQDNSTNALYSGVGAFGEFMDQTFQGATSSQAWAATIKRYNDLRSKSVNSNSNNQVRDNLQLNTSLENKTPESSELNTNLNDNTLNNGDYINSSENADKLDLINAKLYDLVLLMHDTNEAIKLQRLDARTSSSKPTIENISYTY